MKKITKEMTIQEAISINKKAAEVLMKNGMHCLGCAMASGETVEQAAAAHNADLEKMLAEMNS